MNINLSRLKDIALLLGDLKDEVIFVGGATVGLYIDDEGAPEPQPSEDIDCIVEIATYSKWIDFEEKLRSKGFQDVDESGEELSPPTCRKFILGMKIDFMPVDENVLGYTNPWFKSGIENFVVRNLDGVGIRILELEYFVATKLKAFNDRGVSGDLRFSQDLEDLTELIDGALSFEKVIESSDDNVRSFIANEFAQILQKKNEFREAMYGFLAYDDAATKERHLDRIFTILQKLSSKPEVN